MTTRYVAALAGLAVSTVLGVAGWFLPGEGSAYGSAAGALLALLFAYAALTVPPLKEMVRFLRGYSADVSFELPPEFGSSAYENPQAAFAALKDAVEDSARRSEARSARSALELQALRQNITALNDEVRWLNRLLKESQEAREQDRTRTRWLTFLTFWGGIALSIPIGVVINLSTR
jgi:hypothetical protein